MIRVLSRKICTALNITPIPPTEKRISLWYTQRYNEINTPTYTHMTKGTVYWSMYVIETKTVYIDHDMSNYDELNDLPRISKNIRLFISKLYSSRK